MNTNCPSRLGRTGTIKLLGLLLYAFFSLAAQAQTEDELSQQRQVELWYRNAFSTKDAFFQKNDIPEKWQNRSAVVVGEKIEIIYGGPSGIYFKAKVRRQVKLLNQQALVEYGAFKFEEALNMQTGIQIVKPDGKIVRVRMESAEPFKEELNNERTRRWNSYLRSGGRAKKVALSGLEIGDIVDVVVEITGYMDELFVPRCSDLMEFSFDDEYPILKKQLDIEIRKKTAISAISLHNAPKLKLISDPKSSIRKYRASAEMVEEDSVRNTYAYAHLYRPILKVQICLMRNKEKKWDEFVDNSKKLKTSVSNDEIQARMLKAYVYRSENRKAYDGRSFRSKYQIDMVAKYYTKEYVAWLNKYFRSQANPTKVAEALFYRMRYDFFYGPYAGRANPLDDELFASIFVNCLKQHKESIDVRLMVAPRKDLTVRKQLIARSELLWAACLNYKGEMYVYHVMNRHSLDTDQKFSVAGVEGILIHPDVKESAGKTPTKFQIKPALATDHVINISADVSINDKNELQMGVKNTYKGFARASGAHFLTNMDFAKDDEALYMSYSKETKKKSASSQRMEQKDDAVKAFDSKEEERNKLEMLKRRINRIYSSVEYEGYEVVKTGRTPKEPDLIVAEKYTVSDLVSKAGRNLIVSVGLFPGEYSRIDTSLKRVYDISYDFPATYQMEYRLQIPDGYLAEGVEALNTEVSNNTGKFKTTAVVEGKVLKLTVERVYLRSEMPVSDWADFTRFINAASDFNQKKVVLKKI